MKRLETRIWKLIIPVNIIFLVIGVVLLCLSIQVWAGEKEELQWKARALVAEYQLQQSKCPQLPDATTALQAFLKEIDQKGFIYKDGVIIEKPKEVKKPEPPKSEKK